MKNMILTVGLATIALYVGGKEAVIMTVNGVDVPKSEFEYLYHKNRHQQLEPQSLDDYVEMFKIYKLKVADAKASGIDTTESFRREMNQYRRELALPYLTDSIYINFLVEQAQSRIHEDVEASHIMVLKEGNRAKNVANRIFLDSLRNCIVSGGEDFGEVAEKYSSDRSAKRNKGYLGFICAGRFPYDFETAVYTTPRGEVSEIVESPTAYHIVCPGSRRPAKGKVRVSHIMKLIPRDATESDGEGIRSIVDSLYNVVNADPAIFADIAKTYSDDSGSARKGGELPVFGTGEMVPEFETVSFSLRPGDISKPFKTAYGWHIVKKFEDIALPDSAQIRADVMRAISNPRDDRYRHVNENRDKTLAAKHNAALNDSLVDAISMESNEIGLSKLIYKYGSLPFSDKSIAEIDGINIPVVYFANYLQDLKMSDNLPGRIREAANSFFSAQLLQAEENWLYDNVYDYRNLLNEYHDGTLLYEISLEKVWNKASKDTVGLENYFRSHQSDYKWDSPRVSGYLIQASSDSVARLIQEKLDGVPDQDVTRIVKKEFSGVAQADRVVVSEGMNPMVDNLMFGAPPVTPKNGKFTTYFLHSARLSDTPEVLEDVKGQVISDYQTYLESEWVKQLKQKYPVKINKKELKKVK